MASPPIAEQDPCPCFFGNTFVSVDESDATSADFQAPKKENRWCLMEMPKEQIEALEAGQLFHIKAHGSGKAALCTATQTFKLEFLENSNPMYLGNVAEVAPTGAVAVEEENKESWAGGGHYNLSMHWTCCDLLSFIHIYIYIYVYMHYHC